MTLPSSSTLAEQGFPNAEGWPFKASASPPAVGDGPMSPPGGGRFAVPSYQTFQSVFRAGGERIWRTVFWDEALRAGLCNSLAMRNDPVVWEALRSRQVPCVQLEHSISPEEEDDPGQQQLSENVTRALEDFEEFQDLKLWLLEDVYYGKSAAQVAFEWDYKYANPRLKVRDWEPVLGDKLILHYDRRWSVSVSGSEYHGDKHTTDGQGFAHKLTDAEREVFLISNHEREDPDITQAEQGARHGGLGMRSRLWHFWWIRSNLIATMIDFLQLAGPGFLIYWYELGNKESYEEVKRAATEQVGSNVILMPRHADPNLSAPDITRLEAGSTGVSLLENLIGGYYDGIIRRTIKFEGITTETARAELGGDAAGALEAGLGRVVKYDAVRQQGCLTRDLVKVMARYTAKHLPPPRFRYSIDKPDSDRVLRFAQALWEMGYPLDGDELARTGGLTPARPGKAILSKFAAMQPAAVAGTPEGVPVAGPAGPAPPADQGQTGAEQPPQDGQSQQGQGVGQAQDQQQGFGGRLAGYANGAPAAA